MYAGLELMHTELHHLQTLTIMAEVFRRGLREEVGLDAEAIARIFPYLDELLVLHRDFFSTMTERRNNSTQPDNEKNYLIHHVGDILLQQVGNILFRNFVFSYFLQIVWI